MQLSGISSSCDKVDDFDEELKDGIADLGTECALDKPDQWKKSDCTLERTYTCKDKTGGSTRTIVVSTQSESDGSILTGILSIRRLDKSGNETCQGTFQFIESRQ